MKVVAISDTHTFHRKLTVPEGDVLIHAGDITFTGEKDVLRDFDKWMGEQPHKYKIVIGGNHDVDLDPSVFTNCMYLEDEWVEVEGFKIYGSPCSPKFGFGAAFMLPRGSEAIKRKWAEIPHDVDILITHCPPQGILDKMHPYGEGLGCADLAAVIDEHPPKMHIFGHIHGGHGTREHNGTEFINAAMVDEACRLVHNPIIKEIILVNKEHQQTNNT
jgi:Icc-related predicted phosphoesterase